MATPPETPQTTARCYVKHISGDYSVRIIVRSVEDERNAIQRGQWRRSLCTCCCAAGTSLMSTCFLPWLCTPVSIAQVAKRIGLWSFGKALVVFLVLQIARLAFLGLITFQYLQDESLSRRTISIALAVFVASTIFISYSVLILRTRVRSMFKIGGSIAVDIAASCCMPWCTIGQLVSHVKAHESRQQCCSLNPDTLPPYAA